MHEKSSGARKKLKLSDLVQQFRIDVPEQGFTPTLERGGTVYRARVLEGDIYEQKSTKSFIALYNIHAVGHQTSHAVFSNATHGLKINVISSLSKCYQN